MLKPQPGIDMTRSLLRILNELTLSITPVGCCRFQSLGKQGAHHQVAREKRRRQAAGLSVSGVDCGSKDSL